MTRSLGSGPSHLLASFSSAWLRRTTPILLPPSRTIPRADSRHSWAGFGGALGLDTSALDGNAACRTYARKATQPPGPRQRSPGSGRPRSLDLLRPHVAAALAE